MSRLILSKGNLFNPLENRFDRSLIDSSQYDLKIIIDNNSNYYRIRTFASDCYAERILPSSFLISEKHKYGMNINEVEQFRTTELFKQDFPFYYLFNKEYAKRDSMDPSYLSFIKRITGKNTINNIKSLYNFSIPAVGNRKKVGVLSYDIEILLFRNRYYVVLFKENVKKGMFQSKEWQYIIYDKKDFAKEKNSMSDSIVDFAIETGYPLNLLEYIYIMTCGSRKLVLEFFNSISNIHSFKEFLSSPFFSFVDINIKENYELAQELDKYFGKEQDDINYSYKVKTI